jgi:hypothetical protein
MSVEKGTVRAPDLRRSLGVAGFFFTFASYLEPRSSTVSVATDVPR